MMSSNHLVKKIPGEKFTPFALACKLKAVAILESSSLSKGRARYSLLLLNEAFRMVQNDAVTYLVTKDGRRKKIVNGGRDILDAVKRFALFHKDVEHDFPFPAGGIGFLSFEFARFCDDIKFVERNDALGLPDAAFIFGSSFLIFDHYTDEIYILALNYPGYKIDLEYELEKIEKKIFDLNFNYMADPPEVAPAVMLNNDEVAEKYKKNVALIRDEVIKGNLLQGVPSRRLEIKTEIEAIDAYRSLRTANPSPYLVYLDFGDYQLYGASPEVHVKVKNGKVIVRPIAGTRRRGKNEAEDIALADELLADPKERAEHLMLIDLARNDLGRVCKIGTVNVTEYMIIEKYSKVMHIVSQVEGELCDDCDSTDAVRATFPAGTVSGAPKIQAIETISKIESCNRGFYAGLVGYMDATGDLDTCITIRSGLKKHDKLYLQAGGGVVYDSTPERELEETNEKLRAATLAAGIEV
ncbi:MAG TPA: anthranilate synthase component I [Spirochaeta sp.]|nr:anthranilate synthase component I [Spirochaeta sp.]